jgi:SAM-dependent methyltransferase
MTVDILPSSAACERNKDPILQVLTGALAGSRRVLEIGSGTGQHAVHFCTRLPHLSWQPSDTGEYLPLLRRRLQLERPPNLLDPLELDVRLHPWPIGPVDAVFTANTLHIMDWAGVQAFFRGVGALLQPGATHPGTLCVYGPLRYGGRYTSDSNAAFDRFLQERDPASGLRDFDALHTLAQAQGLHLQADHAMPANNQLLVWRTAASRGIQLAEFRPHDPSYPRLG